MKLTKSFQIRYITLISVIHSFDAKYSHSLNKYDRKNHFFHFFPNRLEVSENILNRILAG